MRHPEYEDTGRAHLLENADDCPDICNENPPVNFLSLGENGYECRPEDVTKQYGYLCKIVRCSESAKYN